MTREEMLNRLSNIEFMYLDPPSEWKDIGFTERPIWVNSKGYGYLACDEPDDVCWSGEGLTLEEWLTLREKLENNELTIGDITDTCLWDALDEMCFGYEPEDDEQICSDLHSLVHLSSPPTQVLYGMRTVDDILFFSTEEDFKKAYERDWCDYSWEELEDSMLEIWLRRLNIME